MPNRCGCSTGGVSSIIFPSLSNNFSILATTGDVLLISTEELLRPRAASFSARINPTYSYGTIDNYVNYFLVRLASLQDRLRTSARAAYRTVSLFFRASCRRDSRPFLEIFRLGNHTEWSIRCYLKTGHLPPIHLTRSNRPVTFFSKGGELGKFIST